MKGYMETFFYLAIVIFSLIFIIFFLSYQSTTGTAEVRKRLNERILMEEINSLFSTIFNNKIPVVEKTYMEMAIDAILQKLDNLPEEYKVYYGIGIGVVNLTEIIPPFLDRYAKNRYQLYFIIPTYTGVKEFYYGSEIKKDEILYVYDTIVPLPFSAPGKSPAGGFARTGKVLLYIGKK